MVIINYLPGTANSCYNYFMKAYREKIKPILREIFVVLSAGLLLFALMETVWPQIVTAYVNVNMILIFWLIIGIIYISFVKEYD